MRMEKIPSPNPVKSKKDAAFYKDSIPYSFY